MQSKAIARELVKAMPLSMMELDVSSNQSCFGLVIVDEINGFATVGAGALAPTTPDEQVSTMVAETNRLAATFSRNGMPILAFLDTHIPGKPEFPYPPHCEEGTGEENLVPELKWLEQDPCTTLIRKDCINGFIGSTQTNGTNAFVDWVRANNISDLLVVGICTDICVMDFVLTSLSARNHDMMPGLREIYVYEKGCSTFDLPRDTAEDIGLGAEAAHPKEVTHYMGLYFMAGRGARLVDSIILPV
jgi:nicotinamidase-related amidase